MKYPFDISNTTTFASQFKDALGFTDSDIPVRKVKPDLRSSCKDIIKVIGQSTYDALCANTTLNIEGASGASDPYQDVDLTELFRHAVASKTYALFAPANDLGHTPNGRKMRTSDDEKTPFEWMMVRDDDNNERRYYRALDALIGYMDDEFQTWKDSDEYQESFKLFVRNVDEFDEHYLIDSPLLYLKLKKGLELCEKNDIVPRIGKDLSESIKTKLKAGTDLEPNEEELLYLIREATCFSAMSWGLIMYQANLFPKGVFQAVYSDRNTITAKNTPQFLEADQAAKKFETLRDTSFMRIEELMSVINPPEEVEETDSETEVDQFGFSQDDEFVNT